MRWKKRRRLMVDRQVQGSLIIRVVGYWLACVVTVELLKLTWRIATGPEQPTFVDYFLGQDFWAIGGQFAISSILLVPIVIDILRVSNRFAGPVYRMRRVLQKVTNEGIVDTVRLREDDYWHDFADDLNAALDRLSKLKMRDPIVSDRRPIASPAVEHHVTNNTHTDLMATCGHSLTALDDDPRESN